MENKEILNKIMDYLIQGEPKSNIRNLVRAELPVEISNRQIDDLIKESKQLMNDTVTIDPTLVTKTHLAFYEQIFGWFKEINHVEGMHKALKAKERLLQLIQTSKISFTKQTTVNINRDTSYDMKNLSPQEQQELKTLLEIACGMPLEITAAGEIQKISSDETQTLAEISQP